MAIFDLTYYVPKQQRPDMFLQDFKLSRWRSWRGIPVLGVSSKTLGINLPSKFSSYQGYDGLLHTLRFF